MNEVDERGYSPLYHAVSDSHPSVELAELLLQAGADPAFVRVETLEGYTEESRAELAEILDEELDSLDGLFSSEPVEVREPLLRAALKAGNLEVLQLLHRYGADFDYHDPSNYTAILDAVYGFSERLPVIRYLIGLGLDVRGATSYGETAIQVAYGFGQFGVVAALLEAGANEDLLGWTPLHRAVAIGTKEDVLRELATSSNLRAHDANGMSALHVALLKGDRDVAQLLLSRSADPSQGTEDGRSSLSVAAEGGHETTVALLLESSVSTEDRNGALEKAVENGHHAAARVLLQHGAEANFHGEIYNLLESAQDGPMVRLLIEYGADPGGLDAAGRRKLLDLPELDEDALDAVTRDEYLTYRYPREGGANPEEMSDPFRLAMIRAGVNAYRARDHFDDPASFSCEINVERSPAVWCFDRFGQSTTILPDGRIVLIAGEHEDYYDPDFCIFNDVAVFAPGGEVRVYGYPYSVFPPTDFHTATLVGDWIYVVGSLGYPERRAEGLPVCRLETATFRIEPVFTAGDPPPRIFNHRAELIDGLVLRILGGTAISFEDGEEVHLANEHVYALDLPTLTWSKI